MSARSLRCSTASRGALTLFAVVAAPLTAQFPQSEPSVSQGPGVVVIAPGQHISGPGGTGYAALTSPGQIDIYSFHYVGGETVWFEGYTGGCLDLLLEVLDPSNGNLVVASGSCSGNNGYAGACAAWGTEVGLNPALGLQTGNYLLKVSDVGSNETGSYTVSMVRVSPPAGPMLSNATLVTDTISPVTDVDTIGFTVAQGSLVNLYLRTHGCLDLEYRILDSSGTIVLGPNVIDGNTGYAGACAVNQVSINPFGTPTNPNAPAPTTGTYWIVLRDSGLTETGTYDAEVQCLYSPTGCPNTGTNFTLTMNQPTGPGSLAINVANGTPGAPYITAF
ncbi:MAG TPA: hypothetical protein VFZ65_20135, partial [Planctomycetota bacterium]|nr:hypothetical protein [Planctomycetota bacterium]